MRKKSLISAECLVFVSVSNVHIMITCGRCQTLATPTNSLMWKEGGAALESYYFNTVEVESIRTEKENTLRINLNLDS